MARSKSRNTDMSDARQMPPPAEARYAESYGSTSEGYGEFPPGTIVLAKLKSFPPWPAIVIPDDLIPDRIQDSKPKSAPRLTSHRGKRKSQGKNASAEQQQPSRLWCVRFLRDDTFMWATSNDISLLTTEQIEAFLNSKRAKKVIKSAYEMALDPPDVEEFIIYGSDGKPINIDNEADDEDFKEDYSTPDDEEDEDDDIESEIDDDNDLEILPVKKTPLKGTTLVKRKKSTPAKTLKRTKNAPKTKTPSKKGKKLARELPDLEPDTSSDEDWDVDIDSSEEPVCTEYPDPKKIADQIKKRVPLFKKARLQLQRALLSGPDVSGDLSATLNTLDMLESLEDPQVALMNKAGLHKVLFNILKRPDLNTKDLKKIRSRVSDLVRDWYFLDVPVQENWTFDDPEDVEDLKMEDVDSSITKESTADATELA